MEIDFCRDEMTTSEENQYIFSFKKVIKESKRERENCRGNCIILQIQISLAHCVHQVHSEREQRKISLCLQKSREALRHRTGENLASCTNRR